jgi:sialic acid synthase SpsE
LSNNTYIVAEIGINHEGDVGICKDMISTAAECGADAVKLQTVNADANYLPGSESYNIFKGSELTRDETSRMFDYARKCKLDIFTTAGDIETINWVDDLNPSHWKISSGLLTHIPIVSYLASLGRPLLVSTGMAAIDDIDLAVNAIKTNGNNDISLLQCTSIYPTPNDEINLSTIKWLRKKYGYPVGFSDHSVSDDAVFLSIGVGASIIEKHFSLDTTRPGFDHNISIDKTGLTKMIKRIRLAEEMMGVGEKTVTNAINLIRDKYLRYIVAIKPIMPGDILSNSNIGIKRTGIGISGLEPKLYKDIIGRSSIVKIEKDQLISLTDLENI